MTKLIFFCFLAGVVILGSLVTCSETGGGENSSDDDSADDDDSDGDGDTDGDDDDDNNDNDNDDNNNDNDDNNDDNDADDEDPDEDYEEVEILRENVIDDLEDGNGQIYQKVGRKGDWYVYNDETGEQDPKPDTEFVPKDCGNGSDYCAKTTGEGFTDWGAVMALNIKNENDECNEDALPGPYNAKVFDRIVFQAKGDVAVKVKMAIPATISKEWGGECDPADGDCDDYHGEIVHLEKFDDWRQYRVMFEDLSQEGWGQEADFDPGQIVAIEFTTDENAFSIQIDDLAFWDPDGETNEDVYPDENEGPSDRDIWAGFRASHYGAEQNLGYFPTPEQWGGIGDTMAGYLDGEPTALWVVCNAMDNGSCTWETGDDAHLDYFDSNDFHVILQVEPMEEDIEDLIDEAMNLYGDHPSVAGFGVDVEFYKPSDANDNLGEDVSDEDALSWLDKVQEFDSGYVLMLKHFDPYKMPPCEREGMLFINDSQNDTQEMIIEEYEAWADLLAPADVGFQIGYPEDKGWWSDYDNPPRDLGQLLVEQNRNTKAVLWVDFTLDDVFDL